MSRIAVDSRSWLDASESERLEFMGQFKRRLIEVFSFPLIAYRGQAIKLVSSTIGDGNDTAVVETFVVPPGAKADSRVNACSCTTRRL